MSSVDDDIGDPVVREIDVYLNRLEGQEADTYLLQYPLRPVYRPYGDHGQLALVQRSSETQRLRLTYALNMEGAQFDESRRAQIQSMMAMKAEKRLSAADEAELDSLRLHKLECTEAKNVGQCEYGLGFMRDGRFYLTPVSKILQFRPDFSHIDKAATLAKQRAMEMGDRMEATKDAARTGGEGTPTTGDAASSGNTASTPASAENDMSNVNARIKLTHAQVRKKELADTFTDVDVFFDSDSPESAEIFKLLSTFPVKYKREIVTEEAGLSDLLGLGDEVEMTEPNLEQTVRYEIKTKRVSGGSKEVPSIHCDKNLQAYLDSLCQGCSLSTLAGTKVQTGTDQTAGLGTGPLSYLALSRLPPDEQVKRIMQIREVESFREIKTLLTSRSIDDRELIDLLLKVAIPMHGNWVARSETLYGSTEDGGSHISKWTDLEIHTRDLILCLYAKNRNIDRAQLRRMTQCPPDRLSKVLNSLYAVRDGKFQPKLKPDTDFLAAYERLCKEHEEIWSPSKAQDIVVKIKEFNDREAQRVKSSSATDADTHVVETLDPARVRRSVERILKKYGASSEPFILAEVRKSLTEEIDAEMRSRLAAEMSGGETSMVVRQQVLELNSNMTNALKAMSVHDLKIVLMQCAENFKNLWIISSYGNKQLDPYRKVILNLFKEDVERGVTKKDFREACFKHLKRHSDLPDMQYRSLFREVAINHDGYWYYKGSTFIQQKDSQPQAADD